MAQPSYDSAVGYIGETFFTISFDAPLDAANPPLPGAFVPLAEGLERTIAHFAAELGLAAPAHACTKESIPCVT